MSASEKIDAAWQAKVNLDYEACLRLVTELKQELGVRGGLLDPNEIEMLLAGPAERNVLDLLLLASSLYRALGDRERAERLLGNIEAAMAARGTTPSFRLFYEKASGAYVFGDFHLALEDFLHAALFAERDLHKLWALGNAVLSMENLGLPYERTYRQVRDLMDKLRGKEDLERVDRQMRAFALRVAFRAGKIGEIVEQLGTGPVDQSQDFAHWVRSLPYHTHHRALVPEDVDAYASDRCALHHPFFRLRTLQGVLHPEDSKVSKPSEWADRLYMWTWLWLQDPVAFPADRILVLLRQADIRDVAHRLTLEDAQLVRNALRWLGLFDASAARFLPAMLSRLQVLRSAPEFPLLTLESHLLEYFRALRDDDRLTAADFRMSLEQHPLWASPELNFRQLVLAVEDDTLNAPAGLEKLAENLRQLWPGRGKRPPAPVMVDMVHHQLIDNRSGEKLVSEAACLALHLLRRGEPVGCDQFVQVCFGLRTFDPLVHTGKIFNLLTRIKRVLGSAPAFRMKAGKILVSGDWKHIQFREHGARVQLTPILGEWEQRLTGRVPTSPEAPRNPTPARPARPAVTLTQLQEWDWSDGLGRADIEGLLGTPRSTTNRFLEKWVRQGILVTRGRARSTRYFLAERKQHEENNHAKKRKTVLGSGPGLVHAGAARGERHAGNGRRSPSGGRGEDHLGLVRST